MSRSIAPRRTFAAGALCVAIAGLAFLAVRVIWLDDHTLLIEA